MRKIITALCMLCSCTLHAQSKSFTAGIEGGPSCTSLDGVSGGGLAIRFTGGVFLQYRLNSRIAFKGLLMYERKGSSGISEVDRLYRFRSSLDGRLYKNDIDYLVLPILFTRYGGDKRHFFIQAGPYMGLLLKHTMTDVTNNFYREELNVTNGDKRLDLGLSLGLGWEFPIKNNFGFLIGIRHNIGLVNIVKGQFQGGQLLTNSTNLLVGVNYRLGKK